MDIQKKLETIAYLEEQKAERLAMIEEYNKAKADLDAAQARLDAIGDVSDYEAEIFKLDGFIDGINEEIAELEKPQIRGVDDSEGYCAESECADAEAPAEDGGVVDGEGVTIQA